MARMVKISVLTGKAVVNIPPGRAIITHLDRAIILLGLAICPILQGRATCNTRRGRVRAICLVPGATSLRLVVRALREVILNPGLLQRSPRTLLRPLQEGWQPI